MKQHKPSDHQIIRGLKEVEKGITVAEVCRHHGISSLTYFKWNSKYGGIEASDIRRLKEREAEERKA